MGERPDQALWPLSRPSAAFLAAELAAAAHTGLDAPVPPLEALLAAIVLPHSGRRALKRRLGQPHQRGGSWSGAEWCRRRMSARCSCPRSS